MRKSRGRNSQYWWFMYIDAIRENSILEKKIKYLEKKVKELELEIARLKS